jgi:hypothetical protein
VNRGSPASNPNFATRDELGRIKIGGAGPRHGPAGAKCDRSRCGRAARAVGSFATRDELGRIKIGGAAPRHGPAGARCGRLRCGRAASRSRELCYARRTRPNQMEVLVRGTALLAPGVTDCGAAALPRQSGSFATRDEVGRIRWRCWSEARPCWRQVWPIAVRPRCLAQSGALLRATNSAESRLEVLVRGTALLAPGVIDCGAAALLAQSGALLRATKLGRIKIGGAGPRHGPAGAKCDRLRCGRAARAVGSFATRDELGRIKLEVLLRGEPVSIDRR